MFFISIGVILVLGISSVVFYMSGNTSNGNTFTLLMLCTLGIVGVYYSFASKRRHKKHKHKYKHKHTHHNKVCDSLDCMYIDCEPLDCDMLDCDCAPDCN